MTRWKVLIEGNKKELVALTKGSYLRNLNVRREGDDFLLDYPGVQQLQTSEEVKAESDLRLAILNEARTFVWGKGPDIVVKEIRETLHNGTNKGSARLGCQIAFRGTPNLQLRLPNGENVILHEDLVLELMMLASATDPAFADALHYFHRSGDEWADPYRVYELVKNSNQGEFVRWISKAQQSRFTRSANSVEVSGRRSRHAVSKSEPPDDPMDLSEGKNLVRGLLGTWALKLWTDAGHEIRQYDTQFLAVNEGTFSTTTDPG